MTSILNRYKADPFWNVVYETAETPAKTFEDLFSTKSSYPPYNVAIKDNICYIKLAVAGFKQKDISIEYENKKLTISGKSAISEQPDVKVIHHGIANRSFTKVFNIEVEIEDIKASMEDGLLTVSYKKLVTAPQKKTIQINQPEK